MKSYCLLRMNQRHDIRYHQERMGSLEKVHLNSKFVQLGG